MAAKSILVTGGTGYIGSHTCVELISAGYDVVVVDNLSNSKRTVLNRIAEITGTEPAFHQVDVRDRSALDEIFRLHEVDAVIHFAGLKAVGDSIAQPLRYYHNNITSTLVLCEAMQAAGVKKIVFSSSATVYGDPAQVPITETFPVGATTNPYGTSKYVIERILADLRIADPGWHIALLRYFNPVGAHASGLIGEDPTGIPSNLMPYIAQVAVGKMPHLNIFGNDYPTPDGTGVRDYIHIVDLAKGHLSALEWMSKGSGENSDRGELLTVNLGTGKGYSVLDVVHAFERSTGIEIPYRIVERRPGDIAQCYANPSYARETLGWTAVYGIDRMCNDSWRWQQANPEGY